MRRAYVVALVGTLLAAAGVWWWARPIDIANEELPRPTGYWRRGAPLEGDPEDLARLLSLPYAVGSQAASVPGLGVVTHDPARAHPGINLYVSGHASEALLVDMAGELQHRWNMEFIDALPQSDEATEHSYMRRVQLTPDGDLIVLWQGQGLARIDLRSRLKWASDIGVYNDLYYDRQNGLETLIVIHKLAEQRPELAERPILNDRLAWLDAATGEVLRSISLLDALVRSPWASALDRRPPQADILHGNTVTVLDESMVDGSPFAAGWILFSLREISLVGVLDPETETVVWALQGPPFEAQHEPVLLPGGRILLLDNKGPDRPRQSRVLEVSLTGEVLWSWPPQDNGSQGLATPLMGTVQRLPNGNTLIVESEAGRALEVAPAGEVVWKFETPHRAGERGELIAVLPEVFRIDPPDWLLMERPSRQGSSGLDRAESPDR